MRVIASFVALMAVLAAACGGDDGGGDGDGDSSASSNVVFAAADADRVAHEALPAVDDLPGADWVVVGQDEFGSSDGAGEFGEMLQGTPECETLENLATLGGIFGGEDDEDDEPIGHAQIEIEQQDPDVLIPATIDVEVEIEESAAGSRAEFTIVKDLFESDETSQCLVTVLNRQFTETGPAGVNVEVNKGSTSVTAPQNGARMAFDVSISVAGIEVDMVMRMFFWPYGNANVEAMFVGTKEALTDEVIDDVLSTVNENLQAASSE